MIDEQRKVVWNMDEIDPDLCSRLENFVANDNDTDVFVI